MCLHNPENWKLNRTGVVGDTDLINDDIWTLSPQRQRDLAVKFPVGHAGCIGGQQAMFQEQGRGSPNDPLPWVPDLVGKQSQGEKAVMIIGSAYAPFVQNYTRRATHMPIDTYLEAPDWGHFHYFEHADGNQTGFLPNVVEGDNDYYGRIEQMMPVFNWRRAILTDWCRASFVRRGTANAGIRADKGGDAVCTGEIFAGYVCANLEWHRRRLELFSGKVVLLGNLAHYWLKRACQYWNWRLTYNVHPEGILIERAPRTVSAFWANGAVQIFGCIESEDVRPLKFIVVWHPSARGWNANQVHGLRAWIDEDRA